MLFGVQVEASKAAVVGVDVIVIVENVVTAADVIVGGEYVAVAVGPPKPVDGHWEH